MRAMCVVFNRLLARSSATSCLTRQNITFGDSSYTLCYATVEVWYANWLARCTKNYSIAAWCFDCIIVPFVLVGQLNHYKEHSIYEGIVQHPSSPLFPLLDRPYPSIVSYQIIILWYYRYIQRFFKLYWWGWNYLRTSGLVLIRSLNLSR